MTDKIDFTEIFDAVQMDPAAKKVFLAMSREEQMLAILGMLSWNRTETAKLQKDVIEIKGDVQSMKRSQGASERSLTTSQKIQDAFNDRFGFWIPVLQQIVTVVIQAVVLYLLFATFGGSP